MTSVQHGIKPENQPKNPTCLLAKKVPQILGAPLPRQMHQALAKPRVQATTAIIIISIIIVINHLSHHDILLLLRTRALLALLGPQRLLRALRGRVPRIVGARSELLLAVRVPARAAVAARLRVAPEVGTEAGLPQWVEGRVLSLSLFAA